MSASRRTQRRRGLRPIGPAVVALCRSCHRRYDRGELDLVASLEPQHRAEAAHAVEHVGLVGALRRISGTRA